MYHVFSEGDNVLFRENSDYIFFNNKLASASYSNRLQMLAESIMSTHFHTLLESGDEEAVNQFILKLRKSYSPYYSNKYGFSIGDYLKISKVEISGRESIVRELCYILKNPVHHYVSPFPFAYPYSSASYMFTESFLNSDFKRVLEKSTHTFADISCRQKIVLVGKDDVPEQWKINENGMILPSSYVNINRAQAFWNNNVKQFMYDMNKSQTDARKEIIDRDILDIRSSDISDIEMCKIIDDYSKECSRHSFHHLQPSELDNLLQMLHQQQKRRNNEQIRRCSWGENPK